MTISYCASDDQDGSNSQDIGTDTDQFTDPDNHDYSVLDTGSVLYNNGTDLSGSGINDDIIGTSRPQSTSYDIGAHEFPVAVGGHPRHLRSSNIPGMRPTFPRFPI
jgi:hypothetical protein